MLSKRKGVFKQKLKFVIPLLLLLIGVGFIFAFEFYIKDNINTQKVVVANSDISFKERISKEDLSVMNVKVDNVVAGSYRADEIDYIVDGFASINIKKGTQIYSDLIDDYNLIPDEKKGEFIAPLPNDWIYAVAGSLRRAYVADFYVVGGDEQVMIESLIEDSREYSGEESENENEKEGDDEESNHDNDLTVVNDEKSEAIIKDLSEPILKDIRISSVLDSGNQQVQQSPESPESATGTISELEIIATNEMLKTIQDYTSRGYKLYVVHKFEMSGTDKPEQQEVEEGEE